MAVAGAATAIPSFVYYRASILPSSRAVLRGRPALPLAHGDLATHGHLVVCAADLQILPTPSGQRTV
jgi:hypothetical protein